LSKINSSPSRGTFIENNYLDQCKIEGLTPSQDRLELFKTLRQQDQERMLDPEWQKNNLEYDLRSTEWICNKVKSNKTYAQNLYAALCNQEWQRNEVWQLLKDQTWSCSWRYAGGILADMREEGDYIDWYCSGIQGEPDQDWIDLGHVPEGTVTDQIREDLFELGWIIVNDRDSSK
jgi:hypothetical protein